MSTQRRFVLALFLLIASGLVVASPPTTLFLVRHAEKEGGADPGLDAAGRARAEALATLLRDAGVEALVASQFRRTRATLEPLAELCDLEIDELALDAADLAGSLARMADALRERYRGRTVVVAGHSNTLPPLIAALGVPFERSMSEEEYDDLFVVVLTEGAEPQLLELHYGAPTP